MDSREAREILALYRPGDTNAADPRMAEALELARQDPQLAVWFGQHCAAHVKLPGDTQTLAATAAAAPKSAEPLKPNEAVPEADHIIPANKAALFMIGVAVAITLGVLLWSLLTPPPQNTFPNYRDRMARLVQRSFPVKIMLTDPMEIRQYFRTNGGLYNFALPRNLEKLPGNGAAVFTWHGQPVSLFGLAAGGNTNLYLFLIRQSTFPSTPVPAQPQFYRVGRVMTASWSAGPVVYLLTGPNDEGALRGFVD